MILSSKVTAKVYNDGYRYIAYLPEGGSFKRSYRFRRKSTKDPLYEIFKNYLQDARREKIPKKEILSYIENRAFNERDVSEWFTEEELKAYYKKALNAEHKRIKRYRRMINFNTWNWFVTFTYDDKKETEEGFVKRIRKVLSNNVTRNGWRYIGVRERGSESDRVHYHFIMYIPPGNMIGELFADKAYSTKRKSWQYFTNNTYFQKRFGQSYWQAITAEDLHGNGIAKYLLKYINKSGEKLIYSRHIPYEMIMPIDMNRDVLMVFFHYGRKCILNDFLFMDYGDNSFDHDIDYSVELSLLDWNVCPVIP